MRKVESTAELDADAPRGRNEEKELDDQRREAGKEQALRAREQFEMIRQLEIQEARKAAGLCIQCGSRLSRIDRLFHAVQHRTCKSFTE